MSDDVIVKEYNDEINWYKIYQSGKIEQGTKIYSGSSHCMVKLPINFNDVNYNVSISNIPQYNKQDFYKSKSAQVIFKDKITTLKESKVPQYSNEIISKSEFKVISDIDRGYFEWFTKGYMDIETYTFTINVEPSDAKVVINGVVRNTFVGTSGVKINYTISKEGYDTIKSSLILTKDTTLNVAMDLTSSYTITVVPGPIDSIVKLNGQERSKIKLPVGETVNWEVSKEGFVTESGSKIVEQDETITVNLSKEITITVEAMPDDALIFFIGDY